MLDLTIYSYGYSEIIFHTLQAIAMFRNSNFYTAIVTSVALLTGVSYALQMVAARGEGQWRSYLRKVMGMIVFIHALLLPTVSMSIKDNVEKHYWRVDNIPLAFALPIGVVENFGHILTAGFEQVFSLVDGASAHSYYHYGSVFGARLQKEVLQSKVRDPEFINNMHNFIERCVILPSMIGKQFTKEELVATDDMWGLISSRAGTFTRVPMTQNGSRADPHPTCKDTIPYFEKKFDGAIGASITSLSWKFKGAGKDSKYNPASKALNKNIKQQISALYGNDSVDRIMKHNMMINSIHSYRSGNYPSVKAQLHHEAGGLISGDLAEKTLTGSLAVMKVIIYGSFIFLFPLLILSGGISKYRNWILAVFSLALWPSLFSMLNMIIDFAYQPATIVSYSTWSTELKKFDSIASTAANLTLIIPFLSFWITRMGEGGLMHLAGSIMATANSASNALASEKAGGTRNWDNESIRNYSSDNVSSNKHDSGMQYVSGVARSMMADGSTEMITPGGKALYFGGAGQDSSTGESSYHEHEGISASLNKGARDEEQMLSSVQASYAKSQEGLVSKEVSALKTIAQNTRTDAGYNIDTSTESGRELSKALNAIDRMSESNDYSWEQNAEAHLKSEITLGGKPFKILGIDAGGGGSISASNSSQQKDGQSSEVVGESATVNKTGEHARVNNHENWFESIGVDKNTQESIRESYNESQRLEEALSMHKDKIDAYHSTMEHTKTHAGEYSKDMYQEVIDAYQEKYNVSARDVQNAVSSGTVAAKSVFHEISGQKAQEIMQQISRKESDIGNSDSAEGFKRHHQFTDTVGQRVEEFTDKHGMQHSRADQSLQTKHDEMISQYDKMKEAYEDSYIQQKAQNEELRKTSQEQINKYEKDRIGKGAAGTLGGIINGVGRPQSKPKRE